MALEVNIRKKFAGFCLSTEFTTDGGCLGILGASGCGKSMTLKCIAGIEKPTEGRIVLNGQVLFDSEKKIDVPVQQRRVGYLFQNYALFPTMTVEENLSIAMHGRKEEKRGKIESYIKKFQLTGLEKRYPSQLSGGQQQRVALARMLLCEPQILMLDEPFSALDGFLKDTLQMEMLELIREFSGDVLMVTHSRDEVFKFCDHMVLLSEGNCILKGKTAEIFASPGYMEAARLTGCKNISPIEKISDYELYALAWKMRLRTAEKIEDYIRYVGIRGHRLIPQQNADGENVMKIRQTGYSETPFEKQFLFCNAEDETAEKIWWMKKKESFLAEKQETFPSYMQFPKEHLMLLR
ncbi:MAG: ATP-binding cassette domain-containing protein [Eubacteriales bacterium]|nr:ATP-binding cassette domain-containing protein [Eubacteriales bacterium]